MGSFGSGGGATAGSLSRWLGRLELEVGITELRRQRGHGANRNSVCGTRWRAGDAICRPMPSFITSEVIALLHPGPYAVVVPTGAIAA